MSDKILYVCQKAKECGDKCVAVFHQKPHDKTFMCVTMTARYAHCVACIPVKPEVAVESEVKDDMTTCPTCGQKVNIGG